LVFYQDSLALTGAAALQKATGAGVGDMTGMIKDKAAGMAKDQAVEAVKGVAK
jgi:hypothetical protein